MPGNKEQTGGDRARRPALPGWVPLPCGRRPRSEGPGLPWSRPLPALPRPTAAPPELRGAGFARGAGAARRGPGPAPARGAPPGAAARVPPGRREEGRTHPGRTEAPAAPDRASAPADTPPGPAGARSPQRTAPHRAGCGQVPGNGAALPAPCPPAPRQLSVPSPAGKFARATGATGATGTAAGAAGPRGDKARGGGGRRSPTSALQKACCGWMGEQLQASAGRALPSSSTASQASRLGSAAGILRRGCGLGHPPGKSRGHRPARPSRRRKVGGPAAAAPARRCGRCCGRCSAAFYGGVFFLPRLPLSLAF